GAVCRTHRYAQGFLLPVVFGDVDPPDRSGFVSLEAQALLKQLPAGFRMAYTIPSIPAVCWPWFSWVIRRIARSLLDVARTSNFWRFLTVLPAVFVAAR